MTYGAHKDKDPLETIAEIRKILSESGIVTNERSWSRFADAGFSVRLDDMAVGQVGANGKGISKKYALASAYAEFMERLQAGGLYKWKFGLMDEISFRYPDARELTIRECLKSGADMGLEPGFLEKLAYDKKTITCLPFFDCFEKTVEYFPVDVLYGGFSCTGMCSGNTPQEALVQGVCEIFERYVSQLMFRDENRVFPSIPINRIQSPELAGMMASVFNAGYGIIIKDMTMGGRFPVLAVVVTDSTKTRMKVSAGSFVTTEIALERCLTEVFQGLDPGNFKNCMTDIKFSNEFETTRYSSPEEQIQYERERWRHNQSGRYPSGIFDCGETSGEEFMAAFSTSHRDSAASFDFLIDIIKREGLKLYIRDVSFLGFPAYYVYIPALSEHPDWEKRTLDAIKKKNVSKIFLKLQGADKDQLLEIAEFFRERAKNPIAPHTNFPDLCSMHVCDSHLIAFPRLIPWVMIYNRRKEYKKALDVLTTAMKHVDYLQLYNNIENTMSPEAMKGAPSPAQINWLILYFKMKSQNRSEEHIKNNTSRIFGDRLTNIMLAIMNDGNRIFGSIELPDCGDCSSCPVWNICNYEDWKKIVSALNSKMEKRFPRQMDLERVVNVSIKNGAERPRPGTNAYE